jgi:hypothetical protein
VACLLTSADSVAGLHQVLADTLEHATGWTALRDGAVWWLVLLGLPLAWFVARTLMDVWESRLAATLLVSAVACYTAGAGSFLRLLPALQPQMESMIAGAGVMMGHWLVLAAVVTYARFVILDAQGLIVVRPRIVRHNRRQAAASDGGTVERKSRSLAAAASPLAAKISPSRQTVSAPRAEPRPASTQWVDGSQPERDSYEDDGNGDLPSGDRKLNKSERKRLRKLKAQNRAA